MSSLIKKTSEYTVVQRSGKAAVYQEFILWTALPPDQRKKLGLEDQNQFCVYYHISKDTPALWKKRSEFWPQVTELRREWAMDKTGDVIYAIYRAALKGNDRSQKLWLQYFLGFTEKAEVSKTAKVVITVNDIRWLIEGLPEPMRSEHYANLTKLLVDAEQTRNAGLLEDSRPPEGFAETVHEETRNDTACTPESTISQQSYEV
jgi:hypothetical protein